MLIPKLKLEIVELMKEDHYLGDIEYDLVSEKYSFKRNEEIDNLDLYPAEFVELVLNSTLAEILNKANKK